MWQLMAMALVPVAAAPAPVPVAPASIDFSIGKVVLTMPVPAGYCIPTGEDAALAQLVAAGDKNAVTHATLRRCGVKTTAGANDYTLIKTPVSMLVPVIDRAALIKELGSAFDNPVAVAELAATTRNGDAGADLSKVLGTKIEIKGAITPLGHDDVCAYMGGQVAVSGAGTSYLQPTGVCITSIGGKMVTIARYGKDLAPAAIATLLRGARAIALSMRARSIG